MLQIYTQAAELMHSNHEIDVKSFRTMQHVYADDSTKGVQQASKLHRAQSIASLGAAWNSKRRFQPKTTLKKKKKLIVTASND